MHHITLVPELLKHCKRKVNRYRKVRFYPNYEGIAAIVLVSLGFFIWYALFVFLFH